MVRVTDILIAWFPCYSGVHVQLLLDFLLIEESLHAWVVSTWGVVAGWEWVFPDDRVVLLEEWRIVESFSALGDAGWGIADADCGVWVHSHYTLHRWYYILSRRVGCPWYTKGCKCPSHCSCNIWSSYLSLFRNDSASSKIYFGLICASSCWSPSHHSRSLRPWSLSLYRPLLLLGLHRWVRLQS